MLKQRFGITVDQLNLMIEQQNNLCGICNQSETALHGMEIRNLSIDHNHETGKIRSLLCRSCNLLIGNAKDKC